MFYDEGLLAAYGKHLAEGKKIIDDMIRELEEDRKKPIKTSDPNTSAAAPPSLAR